MVRSKAKGSSAPAEHDQDRAAAPTEAARTSTPATTASTLTPAPSTTTTTDTQATVNKFLSRMLAKPTKAHPDTKTVHASMNPTTITPSSSGEDPQSLRASPSPPVPAAAPLATSPADPSAPTTATSATASGRSRDAGPSKAATTPPPTSASPETTKDSKDSRDKKHTTKPKETKSSAMEALRGARRKPIPEASTKEHEGSHGGSDGGFGRDGSPGTLSNSSSRASGGTSSPSGSRSKQLPKEHSIIHISSQPSFPLGEEEHSPVVYTIESTQHDDDEDDKDDSSIAILPHPAPASPARHDTELNDSLASHIPSVNRSIISRWIGGVAGEATTSLDVAEEHESEKDDGLVQDTQQPATGTAGRKTSATPPGRARVPLQSRQSIVLSSSPILVRDDSGLPLPIATPTPKATTHHTTGGEGSSRAAKSSILRPGTKVLVPDSLPAMPTWMQSLPEDDDEDDNEREEENQIDHADHDMDHESESQYHQPWQSRPSDFERPTPSTLGSGSFLEGLPERVSVSPTSSPILPSLPTTQPMPEHEGDRVHEHGKVSSKSRPLTHGLPAGLTSSFLEELGVRPDNLALRQGTLDHEEQYRGGLDEVEEGEEANEETRGESYHRRKRTKRGGRTEELMYEMEHPRHELPLEMTGMGDHSNHSFDDNSVSIHMAQRDMFPSTLGSLPSSSPSYPQSLQELPSYHSQQRQGESGTGPGGGSTSAPSKRRISGGHLGSASSSKSSGTSSMVSLPSPPSLSFGENVPASYVDELAAIAEQISDHESHE
ncbi:hypothetical protein DFQ26_005118 [Actinomortierella ambigua]|nr:hypothetical protein DFQ26_005118 [Actinomortierella ambigua]